MDREGIAAAGLRHSLARLSGFQRVCVVTESPDETIETVAGLIRAADLDRDRFVILVPSRSARRLSEVLAGMDLDLDQAIASGSIALTSDLPEPLDPEATVAALRARLATLAEPFGCAFAIVDVHHLCDGGDAEVVRAFQIHAQEIIADNDVVILTLYDRSMIASDVVREAVYAHPLVMSHGVLGENLHYFPPREFAVSQQASLDIDQVLLSLGDAASAEEGPNRLAQADAANLRLREANARLHIEMADRIRAEEVVTASEERYRLLVEALPDCVLLHRDGVLVFANQAAADMVGAARPEDVLGAPIMSFVHPDSRSTVSARVKMMLETGARAPLMVERFLRLDGTPFYAEVTSAPLVFEGRTAIQVVMHDITDRRAAEAEIRFKSFLADSTIDSIIVRRMEDDEIVYANDAMCAMVGLEREQLVGSRERTFIAPADQEAIEGRIRSIELHGRGIYETVILSADDRRIPVEVHAVIVPYGDAHVMVSVARDISERKRAEEAIEHVALHDALTGLANRALFNDRLELAVAVAHRNVQPLALLCLDVDQFKAVNDTLGHAAGDELLAGVADRLLKLVRAGDTVARPGGDEFMLVLPGIAGVQDATRVAEKVLCAVRTPFVVQGNEIHATLSIGVAMHAGDDMSAETLVRNADIAMTAQRSRAGTTTGSSTPR